MCRIQKLKKLRNRKINDSISQILYFENRIKKYALYIYTSLNLILEWFNKSIHVRMTNLTKTVKKKSNLIYISKPPFQNNSGNVADYNNN